MTSLPHVWHNLSILDVSRYLHYRCLRPRSRYCPITFEVECMLESLPDGYCKMAALQMTFDEWGKNTHYSTLCRPTVQPRARRIDCQRSTSIPAWPCVHSTLLHCYYFDESDTAVRVGQVRSINVVLRPSGISARQPSCCVTSERKSHKEASGPLHSSLQCMSLAAGGNSAARKSNFNGSLRTAADQQLQKCKPHDYD